MEKKLLRGTSSFAFDYLVAYFRPLLCVTAVPTLVYFTTTLVSLLFNLQHLRLSGALDPENSGSYLKLASDAANYFGYVVLIWIATRVFALHGGATPSWTGRPSFFSKDLAFSVLYVVICVVIASTAFVPSLIVDKFPLEASVATDWKLSPTFVYYSLFQMAVSFASIAVYLYLFSRLIVGLCRVFHGFTWHWQMLSRSWSITRKAGFELPVRIAVWAVLTGLAFSIIYSLLLWGALASDLQQMGTMGLIIDSGSLPLLIAEKILPVRLFLSLCHVPMVWFFSILLAESSERLFAGPIDPAVHDNQ